MDYSKKSKYKVITEGPSPEENDILGSLQDLINQWDECEKSMPDTCDYKNQLQSLIKDYTSRSVNEAPLGGSNKRIYNRETKEYDSHREQMDEKVFYKVVKSIVDTEDKKELQDSLADDGTYEGLYHLHKLTKLYGIPDAFWSDAPDGLAPRLVLAAIDNYDGIKNGTINNFEGLSLTPLKSYRLELTEHWVEHIQYRWTVVIDGYDERDVEREVYMNEDGMYSYWEWDHKPGYEKEYGDADSDGIEIESINQLQSKKSPDTSPTPINESSEFIPPPYAHTKKVYTITPVMASLMKHIDREFSKEEIKGMVNEAPANVEIHLGPITKLYSMREAGENYTANELFNKQILQFMWNKNLPADYSQFIGEQLPLVNQYTAVRSFIEWDKIGKDAYITLEDTNWESARCEILESFWDYSPEYDNWDTMDSEFVDDSEEWDKILVDGKTVWSNGESGEYDPHAGDCDEDKKGF